MATTKVTVVEVDTDPAKKSIKSLRKELKDLKDEMANLEEGSDAFLEVANKAGEVKHQIDEIQESVSGASADFGDLLGASTNALNGIIGGFTAAQGALSLFGIESEDILKTIKQLQSLMAIGQGIASIDSGIKAMNKLQHAIKGTSVAAKVLRGALTPKSMLLIIAALTTLTKLWQKFGDDIKTAIPLIGKVTNVFNTWNTSIEDNIKKQEELQKAVDDTQKKYDDIVKENKIAKLNSESKKTYDDLIRQQNEINALVLNYQTRLDQAGNNEKEWNKIRQEANDALVERDRLLRDINNLLADPKSYEEPKKVEEVVKSTAVSANELIAKLDKSLGRGKGLIQPAQEIVSKVGEMPNILDQINASLARQDYLYASGQINTQEYWDNVIGFEEMKLQYIDKGTEAYYKQLLVVEQLKQEAKKATEVQVAGTEDYIMVAQAGISALGNLFSGLADLQDTTTKEGIDKQAQYQYMAAVMNTANAIIGAWTSAMALPAPASFILGGIQTAAAAAMGAVEIAKVKKAAAQAQASLSGSSSTVTSGALASSVIAPVQYSSLVQGAQTESAIRDQRVYVTEQDITSTQRKVHVAETENRF